MSLRLSVCLGVLVAAFPGNVGAQEVRMEVGIEGGIYPAGQWTSCRLTGFNASEDGKAITIRVGNVLEVEAVLRAGRATAPILLSDRSALITLRTQGGEPVALSGDAMGRLEPVVGRLPVLVIGRADEAQAFVETRLMPDRALAVIGTEPGVFLARAPGDFDWIHVVVVGEMTEAHRSALKERFGWFSRRVVVSRPDDLPSVLSSLPFETRDGLAVLNPSLVEVLAAPIGSERPELYRIFGAPRWPHARRLTIAFLFGGYLLVTAVASVFLMSTPTRRRVLTATLVGAGAVVVWASSIGEAMVEERVALFEYAEGCSTGIQTELLGVGALAEVVFSRRLEATAPFAPVAASFDYWLRHPLRLNADGLLQQDMPAGSRLVLMRETAQPAIGAPRLDRGFRTDGVQVWTEGAAEGIPLGVYLAQAQSDESRRDGLRRELLEYWIRHRKRSGLYHLGWARLEGETDRLVVVKLGENP